MANTDPWADFPDPMAELADLRLDTPAEREAERGRWANELRALGRDEPWESEPQGWLRLSLQGLAVAALLWAIVVVWAVALR